MLHACFLYIPTCFMCTFIHFSAFSGTNLLTRCCSASSRFLLFLCFRKVVHEIFSELHRTKTQDLISRNKAGARRRVEGGHRVARHVPGAASPRPALGLCLGPPGLCQLRPFA